MPTLRSDPSVEEKIYHKTAWGGTSPSDREGLLISQNLKVRRVAQRGSRRWDKIVNGILGLLVFSAIVIGSAVARPSYLSCLHLQQTTGLTGGQTITTCTIQTTLWRLTPSF